MISTQEKEYIKFGNKTQTFKILEENKESQIDAHDNRKPDVTYLFGNIKIAMWSVKSDDGAVYENYTINRIYKNDKTRVWATSKSFGHNDMKKLHQFLTWFLTTEVTEKVKIDYPLSVTHDELGNPIELV